MSPDDASVEALIRQALMDLKNAEDMFQLALEETTETAICVHPQKSTGETSAERRAWARKSVMEALQSHLLALHSLRKAGKHLRQVQRQLERVT